jgi:ankyrin repeat protein
MQHELQIAFQASEERKLDLLMTVVPQIIDPNSTVPLWDKNGIRITKASLMHIACFSGSYDCVEFLIKSGAEIGLQDVFLINLEFFCDQ